MSLSKYFASSALRIAIILITVVAPAISVEASTRNFVEAADTLTAREAFVKMPQTLIDLLPLNTRLDMLDYYDVADSLAERPNAMRGLAKLVTVAPDYLKVKISSASDMQIKILQSKKGPVIMTIYTVGAEEVAPDSEIRFYTPDYTEIPISKIARLPVLKDFISLPRESDNGKKGRITMADVDNQLPFYTTLYEAHPGTDTVTARLTVGPYLSMETRDFITPLIKGPVSLIWNGRRLSPNS